MFTADLAIFVLRHSNGVEYHFRGPPNLHSFRDFVSTFINFPKPLIAAVNGPAIGVSVTLLGLCDLVYAADNVSESEGRGGEERGEEGGWGRGFNVGVNVSLCRLPSIPLS